MTAPEQVRLSAAEGEALIARLSVYAPSRSDCEMCIQVIRLYFWFTAAVEEAKLSLKKLRTLLLGRGPKRPKPCDPASSSVCDSAMGEGEATGDASGQQEAAATSEAVGGPRGRGNRSPRASLTAAIVGVRVVCVPRPTRGRTGSSGAMRSWRWDSVVRWVDRAPYRSCPRFALTAMPCSAPCATSCKSGAVRPVASSSPRRFPRRRGKSNTVRGRERC